MTFKQQVSIIGTGAVGTTLAAIFHDKGLFISGLYNRTLSKLDKLAKATDAEYTGEFPESLEYLGDICFICVPDDSISDVAIKLSELEGIYSNVSFVHTSGTQPASVLKPLQDKGSKIASFHPLQTFDSPGSSNIFAQSYISLQGDELLISDLCDLSDILEAKYIIVDEEQKHGLHMAAVFASNYMVALMEASRNTFNSKKPEIDVIQILKPLISKTWENIQQKGVENSLTGPISRGDSGTVKDHLKKLKKDSKLKDSYISLGLIALDISQRKGLDSDKVGDIQKVLDAARK